MKVKVKQMVEYAGHSISANGSVKLTLKAGYSELTKSMELMQMLNNNVSVKAKVVGEKAKMLGSFMIKQIIVDGDGESKIKLDSLSDYVETDNLNSLPLNDNEVKEFVVLYETDIEKESEE